MGDTAMRAGMPHGELKWEIPAENRSIFAASHAVLDILRLQS